MSIFKRDLKLKVPGRRWAYACAQLGGAASIAANIAHSFVPPASAEPGWMPQPGAVISSVFWPVALFFAIEAIARVAWTRGWWVGFIRYFGLTLVALVAAVVSYLHLSGLLASYGASDFEIYVGPLAVDGLMIIGTAALIITTPRMVEWTDRTIKAGGPVGGQESTGDAWTDRIEDHVRSWSADTPVSPAVDPWHYSQYVTPAAPVELNRADQVAEDFPPPPGTGRTDAELINVYGDQIRTLMDQGQITIDGKTLALRSDGLTRYMVEKVTGAKRRQAERILRHYTEEVDLKVSTDELKEGSRDGTADPSGH